MSYWRISDSRGGFFGQSNFKTASDDIKNGSLIARDDNKKVIVRIQNGQIISERCIVDGKTEYLCHYGNVSKRRGHYYLNYRTGSARQLDGLSRRWDEDLFGHKGACHSFYRRGRLMWQKFWYSNGHLAYHWNCRKASRHYLFIKDPAGNPMLEFKGLEGPAKCSIITPMKRSIEPEIARCITTGRSFLPSLFVNSSSNRSGWRKSH